MFKDVVGVERSLKILTKTKKGVKKTIEAGTWTEKIIVSVITELCCHLFHEACTNFLG